MKRYRLDIALALGLCVLTTVAYHEVVYHDWVGYDDAVYVTQNPNVQQGLTWDSFVWAWTGVRAANWHPLTMLSHIVDYHFFGLWAGGHYRTNLAFHLANVVLLFLAVPYLVRSGPLLQLPAREGSISQDAALSWKSAFVAAMFAIHPLHVESVAWVAERKDVLSTFFFLFTLLAYGWYVRRPSVARMTAVTLAMTLGLLAKPMLVTLPGVLLLLDFWPLGRLVPGRSDFRRQLPRVLLEKSPLFLLSLVFSVITYKVQNTSGAVRHLEHITFDDRIANSLMAYAGYLGQMLWPTRLAAFYPHPGKYLLTRPEFLIKSIVATLVLVALTMVAIWLRRRRPYVTMGWFWYLGTLVPVIGLVQVGSQAMADRYTYIPLIGLFIVVAWGVPDLLERVPGRRLSLAVTGTVVVLASTWLTWRQVQTWESDISLWTNVLSVIGDNAHALCGVATPLAARGETDEAYEHVQKAIRLAPNDPFVQHCLAGVLVKMDKPEEALVYYTQSIQGDPRKHLAYAGRAAVYRQLERQQEAVDDYQRAIALEPLEPDYHHELASVLVELKRYPLAEDELVTALRYSPNDVDVLADLGNLYARLGRRDEAITQYRGVLEHAAASDAIRENLAALLFESGQLDAAAEHYAWLVEKKPQVAKYALALGRIALAQRRLPEAQQHFREAIRLEPDTASHHLALAAALKEKPEHLAEAIEACHTALELAPELIDAHLLLAQIHAEQGDLSAAAEQYEAVLSGKPDSLETANNFAWLLATSDDHEATRVNRAVELAERICRATEEKDHAYLDTLAAAYAHAGRFDDAVRTAKRAVALARAAQQDEMAEQIDARLKLYEAGQPFREA